MKIYVNNLCSVFHPLFSGSQEILVPGCNVVAHFCTAQVSQSKEEEKEKKTRDTFQKPARAR
jgi:hypothetical protein